MFGFHTHTHVKIQNIIPTISVVFKVCYDKAAENTYEKNNKWANEILKAF